MKTIRILTTAIVFVLFTTSITSFAQTTELTVVIKGIKEAKGKIMIAVGDRSNPLKMTTAMIPVNDTEDIIYVLKNIPVGKTNLYAFQDLNENFQLEQDEQQIPIEPCYSKENITIKESENKIEIKLININELRSKLKPKNTLSRIIRINSSIFSACISEIIFT